MINEDKFFAALSGIRNGSQVPISAICDIVGDEYVKAIDRVNELTIDTNNLRAKLQDVESFKQMTIITMQHQANAILHLTQAMSDIVASQAVG